MLLAKVAFRHAKVAPTAPLSRSEGRLSYGRWASTVPITEYRTALLDWVIARRPVATTFSLKGQRLRAIPRIAGVESVDVVQCMALCPADRMRYIQLHVG